MADRISTAVRLPRDLHEQLLEAAEIRDVSVNYLVTRAVENLLATLPTREQIERTLRAE